MLYYINKLLSNNKVQSVCLILFGLLTVCPLITYNPDDPSFNTLADRYPSNIFGYFGSYFADGLYQSFGIASCLIPISFFVWGYNAWYMKKRWLYFRIVVLLLSIISLSIASTKIKSHYLPAGTGGTFGTIVSPLLEHMNSGAYYVSIFSTFILLFLLFEIKFPAFLDGVIRFGKALTFLRPSFPVQNKVKAPKPAFTRRAPFIDQDEYVKARSTYSSNKVEQGILKVAEPLRKYSDELSELPSVGLLRQPDNQNIKIETATELQQTAKMLLAVLGDFGVKGQIINISQGPVVTLYEFEPSAGTKSSRIIGLSDDIARSLSAISTRIAVIPGRNVMGIELPNKQRAFFCLRELIETQEYQDTSIMLPLILGKDLAGKPFVADLAKMPHLLVAGTTGSGKSVAINTMIISLLYRYTPEECRLIMIDPKMLELSAYDGIPHLLTPVVTEPSKAVVALKWAVKEMENRYRLMSNVGVRNIAGYNAKILEAAKEGKVLERLIQTGFDPETGKPVYETVSISMEKLPFIVVIVDEMADLMLVAGKDIELSIQRLAQMARAAGIHIIMATQRPSVDVITGVIKANFPSRVSFKVTSKIDSRTILGEQGAEQLLGMGDMLYMGNSAKITRVHGPFVDDKEVEKVTEYLRSTGVPEYITAVTQQPDEDDLEIDSQIDEGSDESLYKRAVQIVQTERKVSISYIQRCLRIGYNRAATLVEKMEQDGIISPANHAGKREVLVDE